VSEERRGRDVDFVLVGAGLDLGDRGLSDTSECCQLTDRQIVLNPHSTQLVVRQGGCSP